MEYQYLWVGIGGFVGANARFILLRAATERAGTYLPYGTFLANLTGSFLIGLLAMALGERFLIDPRLRLLLIVGFLGGYTTFSSYSLEAILLLEQGEWGRALLYIGGSNLLSLALCWGGMQVGRLL